ncbi:hypothetical protein [Haloarcula litorea]|uniref:hypothetical protein n=1 Tax=Haloarcula litorea TaxID=3032579 RepID=UPI0023E78E78|nr:hypothetical protein [Halomicroarcula sp. GDY20]
MSDSIHSTDSIDTEETPDEIAAHSEDGTTIYVAATDYGYSSQNSDYPTPDNPCPAAYIDETRHGGYVVCIGVYEGQYKWDITDDIAHYDEFDVALDRVADELADG